MKTDSRKALINQIMSLDAPGLSVGGSGASFFGGASSKQQALLDVKRLAVEFAAETQKKQPDRAKIANLTNQIEAGLRTLNALNILDQTKLDEILTLING